MRNRFNGLPANVERVRDPKDPKGASVTAGFKRCVPQACFADAAFKETFAKAFGTQKQPGQLVFKDAGQRDVSVPTEANAVQIMADNDQGCGQGEDAILAERPRIKRETITNRRLNHRLQAA